MPPLRRALAAALLALAACLAAAAAEAREPREEARIEALIRAVASLDGAVFIRNGSEHAAGEAAEHLRMKLERAGSRVETAEDFIRLCASRSYLSGRPYRIRFADGREVDAEAFLHGKLRELATAPAR